MLDCRHTFWALGLGAAVVGMLVPTSVAQRANEVMPKV
jgi:hypothetical protein